MFPVILFSTLVAFAVGLVAKWHLDRTNDTKRITWLEFWISAVAIALVTAPGITYIGFKAAISNRTTFEEYWNGWELAASVIQVRCTRDGPCRWEYNCDPYIVTYSCNCDKDGCDTCTRTEWHSCPYCTHEYHYDVTTTLGGYRIASHVLPASPNTNRWRKNRGVPANIIARAGTEPPPFWRQARARGFGLPRPCHRTQALR